MDKIEIIKRLLKILDLPQKQQSDLCALTILGMANVREKDSWKRSTNNWVRIHDIIKFINENYNVNYAENSRETFRKQAIHHFLRAALIETNNQATNSPNFKYRITDEFLSVLQSLKKGTTWEKIQNKRQIAHFKKEHKSLIQTYASKKAMKKMPVKINHTDYTFSTGQHNQLQKAILEEFAPRFAPNSECLYVGDTINKNLVNRQDKMKELGFTISTHDKMPDIILYSADKDWIYFIEAVDSVGPISPDRIIDIERMTVNVKSGKIYVTAFLSFAKYKKFAQQLAWETEVWIAEMPDHMIHLNGDKFLGPRK